MSKKSVGIRLISAVLASSFLLLSAPSHAQIFKDDCSELLGGNCAVDEPGKKSPAPKKSVVTEIKAPEVEPEKPRAVEAPKPAAKPVQLAKTVLPPPEKIVPKSEPVFQRVPKKPVRSISASAPPKKSVAETIVEKPAPAQPKPALKPPQTQAPIRFAAETPRNEPKIERRVFSPSARPPEPLQTASLNKPAPSLRKPADSQPAQPRRIEIRLAPLTANSAVPVDVAFRANEPVQAFWRDCRRSILNGRNALARKSSIGSITAEIQKLWASLNL